MSTEIITTLIALIGTVVGSFSGVLMSNKLTTYRIAQLEEKVNKHNNLIERTFKLEEQIKVANHRIKDLEEDTKHEH